MDYLQRAKRFRTKKRLGQNFLIDADILQTILNNAEITKDDIVLEIGAGMGFLTEQLVKFAKKVIAVELDEDAIKVLEKIDADNLEIIHQDILKTELSSLVDEKVKVVANIPYYITSPIIAHLLGEVNDLNNSNRNLIREMILMVQYEVAQRIVADENSPSKQYGLLSVLAQFWADCEIIKKVSKRSFYPSPKVDSALVKFIVNENPRLKLADYDKFRKVLKAGFAQRRKNIKNCLQAGGFLNVTEALLQKNINTNTRAEALSLDVLGELSEVL